MERKKYKCTRCGSMNPWLYTLINKKGSRCYECYMDWQKAIPADSTQLGLFLEN